MSCRATINSFPHPAPAISGNAPDLTVFGLIGHLSYDLMVLWGKQADDDCDGALMSQRRVDADAVAWLQVLSTHAGLRHISSSHTEVNETCFSHLLSLSHSCIPLFPPPHVHNQGTVNMCNSCENEAETWLWKLTFPCCIYVFQPGSNNLQKLTQVPTFQGWCVLISSFFFSQCLEMVKTI